MTVDLFVTGPNMEFKVSTRPKTNKAMPIYTPSPFKAPDRRILALDFGTLLGYSFNDDSKRVFHGSEQFSPKLGRGQRWAKYRIWLLETLHENKIERIVFEDVKRHAGTIAAHVYGGFLAITEMAVDQLSISMHPVNVGTVKKEWTGNGSAKKELMIEMAQARGFRPKDDNAADALAILHCYACGKK